MPPGGLDRRLTFYAWENADERHPFDRLTAATILITLPDNSERKYRRLSGSGILGKGSG